MLVLYSKTVALLKGEKILSILYLWLEKYNTFEKLNVNFGGKYLFNYIQSKDQLEMKENSLYIDNFFNIGEEGSEISNLTAIVGSNGSGKTTLLEVLRNILSGDEKDEKRCKYILVTELDGEMQVHSNLGSSLQLPKSLNFSSLNYNNTVFISTIFDRKVENKRQNEINLSTNFLLKNNETSYESNKIRQDLAFLQNNNKLNLLNEVNFILPEKLIVHINDNLNYNYEKNFKDTFSDYSNLTNLDINDSIKKLINNLQSNFLQYVLITIEHWLKVSKSKYYVSSDIESFEIQKLMEIRNNIIHSYNWDDFKEILYSMLNNTKRVKLLIDLMDFIDSIIHKLIEPMDNKNDFRITFESESSFSLETNKEMFKFIELYSRKVIGTRDFFSFQWRSLSSGEESLLDIFSRLFRSSKNIKNRKRLKNIVIIIDEVENNLHPFWQKQIVNQLLKIIKLLFKDMKIHLILTSHSPFIISDIPHTNIIMLERNGDISNVRENIENLERTFAGNIHTLLAHNFFMKDGLMGTFSKEKINKLYSQIINSDIEFLLNNRVAIEKQINIISEAIIRNKLLSELENRLKFDVRDEIELLRLRLDRLEKLSND